MNYDDLKSLGKEELITIIKGLRDSCELRIRDESPVSIDYRLLLESASDIIFVIDRNGSCIFCNSAVRDHFKDKCSSPEGTDLKSFIPFSDLSQINDILQRVLNGGEIIKNELIRTDGNEEKEEYFMATFSPLVDSDSKIRGLIGIFHDHTERFLMQRKLEQNSRILEKKVREQLDQSESLKNLRKINQELIDQAPIGIFLMDPTGIVLSENPGIKKIMGYPDDSRVGFKLLEYKGFIEAGFADLFERCISEKRTMHAFNAPYLPISQTKLIVVDITIHPFLDESGIVQQVVLMIEDHTEQALIARKMNWHEKVNSINMLAAGIAARLRRPINKMYMDLNFIWNNIDQESRVAEYLTSMKKDLRRIRNLSEQLMALSGTGPENVDTELCQINRVLFTHPLNILLNRMKEEGYNVEINLPDENPTVLATKKQVTQILFDLIENASDAMPEGGSLIIDMNLHRAHSKTYCAITVTDTGCGIPSDDLKKVFQPFFTTKGEDASGLGLMIASFLVESLEGTIGIKSTPGEGTSIRIALPVIDGRIVGDEGK